MLAPWPIGDKRTCRSDLCNNANGWSNSISGRMRVEQSLLAESWNPPYEQLGFDQATEDPHFLKPAVAELAKSDGAI